MRLLVKPGQPVPTSGIYESSQSQSRATMVKGEPAPPTPQKDEVWRQVIETNPKPTTIHVQR